jgi:hypothetical protein
MKKSDNGRVVFLSSSVGVDFPDHKEEKSEVVEGDERGGGGLTEDDEQVLCFCGFLLCVFAMLAPYQICL